ncbi:MAG: 50S ribosomal protein L17 [Pseudobdellovibrio sp.]
MASHRRLVKHFSRKSGPRKALLRGLMNSLVEHGRIKTTVAKAKEVKRHIEKAITLGKKGDLNATRLLISRLANQEAALSIVKDISPRFKERAGGYTRVIKIGRRPGDAAEMAFLEFVDFDFKAKVKAAKSDKKEDKAAKKTESKTKKVASVAKAKAKKVVRKIQAKSRSYNFAQK